MEPRVQTVIRLLTDDLSREPQLVKLAEAVNLSPSRLRHLFKDETGISLTQYLRAQRMGKAKELLEDTFLNIKEVMLRVGVKDKSHFVRAFKEVYGLSPFQYRSQFKRARHAASGDRYG